MFIVVLSNIANGSKHTKCMSLSNQKYMIQATLINLHPNEYSQEFYYYPFAVKLSNKVCVPNKTEDLNLSVLIMISGIN